MIEDTERAGVFDEIQIESLKTVAKLAKQQEREAVQSQAAIYLKRNGILIESEIRCRSVAASLDRLSHLAHEQLNDYAQLVGWDGKREDGETVELSPEQIQMIAYLLDSFADAATLKRQRRGWLAVHFPAVAEILFAKAKSDAEAIEAEPSSIDDDRFRGKVLADLIEGLREEVFTQQSLSYRIMQILIKQAPDGTTHLSKLKAGAPTHTGKPVRKIAQETGLSRSAVERATKTIDLPSVQERITKVLADGQPHTTQEIIAKAGVSLRNFNLEVKKMGRVEKIKRGIYQLVSD